MQNIKYKHGKHDLSYKRITKAVCVHCLQKSTFRVIMKDGVNRLACTQCLNSCRFDKKFKPIQHPIIKVTHLTTLEKIHSLLFRVKRYFLGDHIYGPFKRKRTK